MRGKIVMMVLLCALLVGLVPPGSAHAEEVHEWSNFAEWCYYNGVDMEDLPVEYDDSKGYVLAQWGGSGSYKHDYLFVFDLGKDLSWSVWVDNNHNVIADWKIDDFVSVYRIQYLNKWFDYTGSNGSGWQGVSSSSDYHAGCSEPKYSDVCIPLKYGTGCKFHKTVTGECVDFQFAVADISETLRSTLESYSNYVVSKNAIRPNDWKSEQIMIAVSNGNKLVVNSGEGLFGQVRFTTGSGAESGKSYIYCSNCCYWNEYNSETAYTLGGTSNGKNMGYGLLPEVIYSSLDIYHSDVGYDITDRLWKSAIPYSSSVTPAPSEQEVVTGGFPRLFDVTSTLGYVREYADTDSVIKLAVAKGKGGLVTGVTYDNSGVAWYSVSLMYSGEECTGYILANSVNVGYSVPSVGGGSVAPVPTVSPPVASGQATITKNLTAIYEEPSATSQVQHYVFEGGVVYIVEEYGDSWYYVRYDMGGISYTGYVAKENVDYDTENGFASESVPDGYEGQVDDLLGMVGNVHGYEGQVDDLLGMVGNVPKMIMVLFSFLPPWCLALVGVSFTAMLALIGWKLLRG